MEGNLFHSTIRLRREVNARRTQHGEERTRQIGEDDSVSGVRGNGAGRETVCCHGRSIHKSILVIGREEGGEIETVSHERKPESRGSSHQAMKDPAQRVLETDLSNVRHLRRVSLCEESITPTRLTLRRAGGDVSNRLKKTTARRQECERSSLASTVMFDWYVCSYFV